MTAGDWPLGAGEIADRLGVSRGTIYNRRSRGDFPPPDGVVGGNPAWWPATIDEWVGARRRIAQERARRSAQQEGAYHRRWRLAAQGLLDDVDDERTADAVMSVRRLGGASTDDGTPWGPAANSLARSVADAVRDNPPGAVVELPSPVPFVRHILVVPE